MAEKLVLVHLIPEIRFCIHDGTPLPQRMVVTSAEATEQGWKIAGGGNYVQQLTATKCRIKALLLYEGIAFPDKGDHWSARVLDELLELSCSQAVRFKLDQLIGTLHFHFNAAAAAQQQIRHYCQNDQEL